MYIPRKIVKGKHYAEYVKGIRTKAAMLKEALVIAGKEDEHQKWLDFIPAKFTLQIHGWFPPEIWKNLNECQAFLKKTLKAGQDPVKEFEKKGGKFHYDLRIKKATAPCFDEQTEILTEEGWKYFKDLKGFEKVATLGNNWQIIYKQPLGLYKKFFQGQLIGCFTRSFNMLVTPTHRCFFKALPEDKTFRERFAYEIFGKRGQFTRRVNWQGQSSDPAWFEFLGFWFAEGYARFGGIRRRTEVVLTQGKVNETYVDNLLERISHILPKSWSKYYRPDGTINWTYYNKNLAREFASYGKANFKRVPDFIRFGDRQALSAFIKGFTMGDGSYRPNKDWVLFSSSKNLVSQLQEIALKAGLISNFRTHTISKDRFSSKPMWKLCISVSKIKNREVSEVRKKNWHWVNYQGYVYDVNMPDTIVLVRRNGVYHWSYRTWFGQTFFRAPWTGTIENKVMGTVKGYQSIAPGGAKLQKFLLEQADKEMAKEGIAERRDRPEWMKIKAQWFPVDSPGNPQKNQPAIMLAIEYFRPSCLHRRELDFFDVTFFGDYLKGRYFNRLVERQIKTERLMEWQKEAIKQGKAKAFYDLSFYFWKAKEQWDNPGTVYSMNDVRAAALGKKTLEKISAPPSKEKKKEKKVPAPPLASKEFH